MNSPSPWVRTPKPGEHYGPQWVITVHVARSAMRWAVIWGVVFGLFVVATVKAFVSGYPTLNDRIQLARSLQSFAMLLGVPHHAETVAGFTSWRILVAIAIIGAVWGLLTSTAVLRGEEEAGRWEILLAGQTTKRWATAQALLGLGAALGSMFVATALLTVAAGHLPGAHFPVEKSILFSLALVSGAAMFLAVGALASQVSATRGQAATIAGTVLAASYVVRMIADSRGSLGWMRWISPIGWLQELRPLQSPQLLALAPVIALVLACSILAVLLAGHRDLNESIMREREVRALRIRWLVGPASLAVHLSRPALFAWLAGIATMAAIYGSLTRSATAVLTGSPNIAAILGRLGVRKTSEGYLGIVFLIFAVLIAVIAASQVATIRDEEASGRLDNLLVRPVRRITWLVGRTTVSLTLVLLAGLTAGFFTWVGAAGQRIGTTLPTLLEAGLNAAVPGVFVLGAGILVLGVRPRLCSVAAYGIVSWSLLLDLLGSLIKGNDWLRNSSLFAHMALAPAAKPDWETAAAILLLGVGAAVVGAATFHHRDIEYT